jgi:ribulose-5-phosphate 4-epimerase/fuculose-1-phosphate aldolase
MNRDLPPITIPLALLGRVPVVSFMMPGSEDLAAAVASAIAQETTCCLLQNHGLVCTGPGLEKALESAVYVEEGAQVAINVLAAGGELSPIPVGMVDKMRSAGREGKSL